MNNIIFIIIITILYCLIFYYFIYSLYIFNGQYIDTIKYNNSFNILNDDLFTRNLLKNNSTIILDIIKKYNKTIYNNCNNSIDNNIKYICYYNDIKIYCKTIDLYIFDNYTNYILF